MTEKTNLEVTVAVHEERIDRLEKNYAVITAWGRKIVFAIVIGSVGVIFTEIWSTLQRVKESG